MFTKKTLFTLIGKHALIAVGFVLFASVTVFFLSEQVTKISTRSAKDRQLATQLSERTETLSRLKNDTDIIGSNGPIVKQAFIPSNNILDFVTAIETLATNNNVRQQFHFSSPATTEISAQFPVTTINYQSSVSSNIFILINYLKDFEKLPYFTKIDSVNISSGEGGWTSNATMSFSATVVARSAQ